VNSFTKLVLKREIRAARQALIAWCPIITLWRGAGSQQ